MLTVTSRERRRDGWGFKDLTETNLYPIQSLPHTIHNLYSQGSLSSTMTNRPVRPQAFRSSSRLLPRAWACTGNEDHCSPPWRSPPRSYAYGPSPCPYSSMPVFLQSPPTGHRLRSHSSSIPGSGTIVLSLNDILNAVFAFPVGPQHWG